MSTAMLALAAVTAIAAAAPPKPAMVFGTTIRVAETYASSPGAGEAGDGCLAAEARLRSGNAVVSEVVFDGLAGLSYTAVRITCF